MACRPRGLFIVFHQDKFQPAADGEIQLNPLPGYRKDVINLCTRFWIFGYYLRVYVNLTAQEMTNTVHSIISEVWPENDAAAHDRYSSLVLCILSHGGSEGVVYGVDNRPVLIDSLKSPFEELSALEGKLKLFIIQACRGNEELIREQEEGNLVNLQRKNVNQNDDSEAESDDERPMDEDVDYGSTVTLWPQHHGYRSYVNDVNGSYLVKVLCSQLQFKCNVNSPVDLQDVLSETFIEINQTVIRLVNPDGKTTRYVCQNPVIEGIFGYQFDKIDFAMRSNEIKYYDDNDIGERLLERSSIRLQLDDDNNSEINLLLLSNKHVTN